MIIGTIALLSILFSDAGEIFLAPKVDKKLKIVIVDKDRKKEAVDLYKTTKKRVSKFEKSVNKTKKNLKKNKTRMSLTDSDAESKSLMIHSLIERKYRHTLQTNG